MVGLTSHTSQVCGSQSPSPHGRPLLTCASTGDTQKLKGRSGSVSCGVTAPFSWVLVHTGFCAIQESVSCGSSVIKSH